MHTFFVKANTEDKRAHPCEIDVKCGARVFQKEEKERPTKTKTHLVVVLGAPKQNSYLDNAQTRKKNETHESKMSDISSTQQTLLPRLSLDTKIDSTLT